MQGITSFISAKTSRIIAFGVVYLLLSSVLIFYYSSKATVRVEDYYFTEINYQKIYFNESASNIILISNGKEYKFPTGYLKRHGKINLPETMQKLSSTTTAKVWLDDKNANSPFIRGIKTDNFYFSPEMGADIDNGNNKGMAKLFVWFVIGGIVIIMLGLLRFFTHKRSKNSF